MTLALEANFFGDGGPAAVLRPMPVLAPKKTPAMIEHDRQMAAARQRAEVQRAADLTAQRNAKYVAERAKAARAHYEFEVRMRTENTPEAIEWRKRQKKIHSSGGGGILGSVLSVADKAAKGAAKGVVSVAGSAVKGAGVVVKTTAKGLRTVGKGLAAVPVVGGGLKGVFDLTISAPFQVADNVVKGKRLDHVAIAALKSHVGSVQAVAPYAQTVVSLVPAVGPGLSAGLGAGLALAAGASITDAMMQGAQAALPGGALARGAFNVGRAAVEGKPIDDAVINSLPVGKVEKQAIRAGLDATKKIARGENVAASILEQADRAVELLPKETRGALKTGIALAQGKSLQQVAGKAAGGILSATGTSAASIAAKGGDVVGIKVKVPKPNELAKQAIASVKPVGKVAASIPAKVTALVPKKAVQTVTKAAASVVKPAVSIKPAASLGKQLAASLASGAKKQLNASTTAIVKAAAKPLTDAQKKAATAASGAAKLAGAKALLANAPKALVPKPAAPKPIQIKMTPKPPAVTAPVKAAPKAATPKAITPSTPKAAGSVTPPKTVAAKTPTATPKTTAAAPAASSGTKTEGFFIPTNGAKKGQIILTSAAV
jgi:hypothetical protein